MPKIKMSDIKSGSENVKAVFRKPMSYRNKSWLKKQKFSNNELIEILDLADNKERHRDYREFLQMLVLSQEGPFNLKMFENFVHKTFHKDTLLHLIEHTKGLDNDAKSEFINYSVLTAPFHFIPNFYKNGECNKYGMDVKKYPFNISYAVAQTTHADSLQSKTYEVKEYNEFLYEVLDTLSEDDLLKWYDRNLRQKHFRHDLILGYENCPEKLFMMLYESSDVLNQRKMAKHTKCPNEIKVKVYEETGDESYLPKDVQDIFIFDL